MKWHESATVPGSMFIRVEVFVKNGDKTDEVFDLVYVRNIDGVWYTHGPYTDSHEWVPITASTLEEAQAVAIALYKMEVA